MRTIFVPRCPTSDFAGVLRRTGELVEHREYLLPHKKLVLLHSINNTVMIALFDDYFTPRFIAQSLKKTGNHELVQSMPWTKPSILLGTFPFYLPYCLYYISVMEVSFSLLLRENAAPIDCMSLCFGLDRKW